MSKNACTKQTRISKNTVVASFEINTDTRDFLDSLSDDQWQITSFDETTRIVCIVLLTNSGMNHISLTLPAR